jgi:4-amino-4-deoxy-L-arabinose transferase-like glycosyltransferase
MQYLESQVLRSFTTNRMNPSHADGGSLFYYLGVVIRYGWPWWWLVPLGWILALRRNTILARRSLEARALGLGLLFFLAFVIPFSLSQFQLPHYIHPTYLALAPTAVWAWQNLKWVNFKTEKWARWSLSGFGILVWLGMTLTTPPMSRTSNRGVEFAKSQSQVLELASAQQLFLHPQEIDAYRAEANTLWYWRGRAWKWSDSQEAFEFPNPSECRFSPESALVYCRP